MKKGLNEISKLLNDAPPLSRECRLCKQDKPFDQFQKHNKSRWGRTSLCKQCFTEKYNARRGPTYDKHLAAIKRREYTPEQVAAQVEYGRAYRRGMTVEQMRTFLAENPDCAICGKPGENIDHCHKTGKIRGHLCAKCNKGLGHFDDDIMLLHTAATYLQVNQ